MANSPDKAGWEARQRLGWWRSHRFLLWRRFSQLFILLLFLSGPLCGIWILRGNYSSSLLLDTVPMTDPLMLLESLLAGHWAEPMALLGGIIVVVSYALLGSRVFCGWVCPLNMVTDFAAWLRRKLKLRNSAPLSRTLRYGMLLAILIGSAVTGTLIWEWINPVSALGRGLISYLGIGQAPLLPLLQGMVIGLGISLWLVLAVFLFDLFIVEHGWCGHLCPLGALHGLIGAKGIVRVTAVDRAACNRCMDCIHVCPEPQVLRSPLFGKQSSPLVLDKNCMSCGRCIDVCAEKVFSVNSRFKQSEVKS